MPIRGGGALVEEVQSQGLCVDCGGCVGLCPYFRSHKGRVAKLFECMVEKGRCHAHCPKAEVDLEEISQKVVGTTYTAAPAGTIRSVLKARAGERMKGRGSYQNGGTVSSLVALAFEGGHIDAAALTDRKGLVPEPKVVTDVEGALACASSKYMAAPTMAAVYEAVETGYSRIAMVGTPCQLTALGQMRLNALGHYASDSIALSIGLFCTWSLDTVALMKITQGRLETAEITGMEVTPPPNAHFSFFTSKEPVHFPLDEVRAAIPEGCLVCPDMTAEFSDLSVGANEVDTAWNTVLVRTEKGEALLREAVAAGYLETAMMETPEVDGLLAASFAKKRRTFSKVREMGLLNSDEGASAFRLSPELVEEILG
ncbi:MAG: Coenzyme F420 hydrogenase/dehydrogenase, beta subunit C-terminal domain [Desulfobacterales bacterium]|nr:Coenzyme F420 hydrogenase/dehydrogenase, beta subunit C-terminal domain [Desulfobacterales bacterium]